jgi:hypothetical protein
VLTTKFSSTFCLQLEFTFCLTLLPFFGVGVITF